MNAPNNSDSAKPVVLVICDYYLPGFEAGGSMRTLVNMVDRFTADFDFQIVTRDHDGPHNKKSYDSVRLDEWNEVNGASVYYLSRGNAGFSSLKHLITEAEPHVVYLNSFFSPLTIRTLLLRAMRLIPQVPILLAPEGELSPGALGLKAVRKKAYLFVCKTLGLSKHVVWKAAGTLERDHIIENFGREAQVHIAPNLPPREILPEHDFGAKPPKAPGSVRLVFLSRVMQKKNLLWLLELLKDVTGKVSLDIYGPVEDEEYRLRCKNMISQLPVNVAIRFNGAVEHHHAAKVMSDYHFFVLPTLGENFGHVCVEAFAAGSPAIISDRTPWVGLSAKGIGWDLPIESRQAWLDVLNRCVSMERDEYWTMSTKAREYAKTWISDPSVEVENRKLLVNAISSGKRPI